MNIDLATLIFVYLLAAIVAGFIAGLFGGGVGTVLIPVLLWIFSLQHAPVDTMMSLAIGTGVVIIAVVTGVSSYRHHRHQAVDWGFLKKMIRGSVLGFLGGAVVAHYIGIRLLMGTFGIMAFLAAISGFLDANNPTPSKIYIQPWLIDCGSLLIAFFSVVLGVNSLSVPFFQKMGMNIRTAIGTSAVLGMLLAVLAAMTYIFLGWHKNDLPRYSTGYIAWGVVVPLAVGGSIFSYLGVWAAHRIPHTFLKIAYSVLLLIIAVKMILAI